MTLEFLPIVFPVPSAADVCLPLSYMRKSHSYFEIKGQLRAGMWKRFSPDLCMFHTYTGLHVVETHT